MVVDRAFRLTRTAAAVAGGRVVNPASRRVPEKLGFVETGRITIPAPARGTKEAVDQFPLDRAAWQKGINRRWAALAAQIATSAGVRSRNASRLRSRGPRSAFTNGS